MALGKTAIRAAGPLALALVGSATWDFAGKPLLLWLSEVILQLGSLGLEGFRDGVYADIGKSNKEGVSLAMFSQMLGLFLGIPLGIIALKGNIFDKKIREAANEKESALISIYRSKLISFSIFVFTLATMILMGARVIYVSHAAATLNQYQNIIVSKVTNEQRLAFISRSASISNRQEFVKLIADLEAIVETTGFKIRRLIIF